MTIKFPKRRPTARRAVEKVAVLFDPPTYAWIKARAARDKTSFSSIAADAAKCGVLCITESEAEDNAR